MVCICMTSHFEKFVGFNLSLKVTTMEQHRPNRSSFGSSECKIPNIFFSEDEMCKFMDTYIDLFYTVHDFFFKNT
jgi:hypothetical protein